MKPSAKNLVISTIISIAAIAAIGYTSCKKNSCSSKVCANGGVCNSGSCTCAAGYYGTTCDSLYKNRFVGTWTVTETGSETGLATYSSTISSGSAPTAVSIGNLNNFFSGTIMGYVTGDSLFIPSQSYKGKTVIGVGYISPNGSYALDDYMIVQYEVIDSATQTVNNYGCDNAANPSQWSR